MGITCQRDTQRDREMYLHLLLLISPALGVSSSPLNDVEGKIIKQLESLQSFIERSKAISKNPKLSQNVAASLEEAEKAILELNVELKLLETEELKFEDNHFSEFNKAKQSLRESRQSVRKLADRTVKEVGVLKVFLKDLDESNDIDLLKFSLDKMKDFMIKTLETLKEALEKYESAQKAFEKLNSSIAKQNGEMEKLVNKDSAEYKEWVDKMNNLECGVVERKTVAFIIADIFGCSGCSAIPVTGPCSNKVTQNVTVVLEKLDHLKTLTDNMTKSGKDFDTTIREAIGILTDEIEQTNNETVSVEDMKMNMDKYPKEYLMKYNSIKDSFVNGLDDLQKSAEEFLAQPVDILMSK